jgi:hypothetical protein
MENKEQKYMEDRQRVCSLLESLFELGVETGMDKKEVLEDIISSLPITIIDVEIQKCE